MPCGSDHRRPESLTLTYIIAFSLLGCLGTFLLTGAFFLFPGKIGKAVIAWVVSYAAGNLLGAAFLGLIPHALEEIPTRQALSAVLAGIVLFFLLEKLMIWHHCHNIEGPCEMHGATGWLILAGNSIHNSSFIYVSLADLLPTLHGDNRLRQNIPQTLLLICGIATIALLGKGH
ncbi:MAG: hypothetical protein HY747_10450 [Elusimicrobia bacterium]|nr:hypothetical protein [Elusimicrobiota bacterium]